MVWILKFVTWDGLEWAGVYVHRKGRGKFLNPRNEPCSHNPLIRLLGIQRHYPPDPSVLFKSLDISVRNFKFPEYHTFVKKPINMHATATVNGRVVAETDNYEVVEGNIYVCLVNTSVHTHRQRV